MDDDTFLRAVRPLSEIVDQMAAHGYVERSKKREMREEAAAASPAVEELAQQHRFAGIWDQAPVDTALSHVTMLLTAGEDAMRTFAASIVADRTPIFSFIPLARAGLECLAMANWLIEPGIGVQERVRRSLNERLASAYEQKRLPSHLNPEPGRVGRLHSAIDVGYELTPSKKGSRRWFAPTPPTVTDNIRRVLGNAEVGKAIYSYASAVTHGHIWGLAQAAVSERKPPETGVVPAAIVISSDRIAIFAFALAMAHHRAFSNYLAYMSWTAPEWEESWTKALHTIDRAFSSPRFVESSRSPTDSQSNSGLWLPSRGVQHGSL